MKALRLCIRNKQLPEWQRVACNVAIYASIIFGSIALVGAALGLSVGAFIVSPILGIITWSVTFSLSFLAVMHFSQWMEGQCIEPADK